MKDFLFPLGGIATWRETGKIGVGMASHSDDLKEAVEVKRRAARAESLVSEIMTRPKPLRSGIVIGSRSSGISVVPVPTRFQSLTPLDEY
ncbi:hypothetical protein TPY_2636 [Sulfobacillus acidophilus TPY]|nr:hypothetical protein TPY_2636 [Sulfobacillus acidophilus TPY]